MEALSSYFSLSEIDDLYQQIGYGSLKLNVAVNKIKSLVENVSIKDDEGNFIQPTTNIVSDSPSSIIVDDLPGLKVRFSRCCNPLPGDEIVGFVTKGHGVTIHRKDCPNTISLKERLGQINVRWSSNISDAFVSDIEIRAVDRVGLISEVAGYMREQKSSLINLNAKIDDNNLATISMTVKVPNKQELNRIIKDLGQIPSVLNAYRRIN